MAQRPSSDPLERKNEQDKACAETGGFYVYPASVCLVPRTAPSWPHEAALRGSDQEAPSSRQRGYNGGPTTVLHITCRHVSPPALFSERNSRSRFPQEIHRWLSSYFITQAIESYQSTLPAYRWGNFFPPGWKPCFLQEVKKKKKKKKSRVI